MEGGPGLEAAIQGLLDEKLLPKAWLEGRVAVEHAIAPRAWDVSMELVHGYEQVAHALAACSSAFNLDQCAVCEDESASVCEEPCEGAQEEPGARGHASAFVSPAGGLVNQSLVYVSGAHEEPRHGVTPCGLVSPMVGGVVPPGPGLATHGAGKPSRGVAPQERRRAQEARGEESAEARGESAEARGGSAEGARRVGGSDGAESARTVGAPDSAESAVKETLRSVCTNLQRKMLGHVMARVQKVQKLLRDEMERDGRRIMSTEHKKLLSRVNQLLWPWMQALCRISNRKELQRIHEWWQRQGTPAMTRVTKCNVVYARFNTRTQHLYIGETEDYMQRTEQHAYGTFRHGMECANPCRKCSEHCRYRKHRVAEVHEWVVVPLAVVRNRAEAKQMEDLLRLKWKPQLNGGDRPYYLLKDTYARDIKDVKKVDRRCAPWKGAKPGTCMDGTRRVVTSYVYSLSRGKNVTRGEGYDLEGILEAGVGKKLTIEVKPGYTDLTNWRRARLVWGGSYCKIIRKNGESRTTTLEQWRPREEKTREEFTAYIEPKRAAVIDREQILTDITEEQDEMQEYDEEHIEFLWRVRNDIDNTKAWKWRNVLWTELQRRYEGVLRKPIEIRIPYLERIDAIKVKGMVMDMIEKQEWPQFLKDWHKKNFRVTTAGSPTIEAIMTNVTKPSWIAQTCKCMELRKGCPQDCIVDGHVLMVGRDFTEQVMRVNAGNVPRSTWYDLFRAWNDIGKQLPPGWRDEEDGQWKRRMFDCTKKPAWDAQRTRPYAEWEKEVPTTKQVYEMRRRLKGMVIGPLDKNKGEMWAACPKLYHKALQKAYDDGYQRVYPAKLSQYRKKRYSEAELPAQILRDEPVPKKQEGSEKDIMKLFAKIYKRNGWDSYAKFDSSKGGLNVPYVLFKAKNMVDRKTRRLKWMKVRPIAPGTKHPMKKLLHYVGRAWSFVTSQIPGEHFVINKTSEVPTFLREAEKVSAHGELQMKVFDIESCYPNMPRETIRFAMRSVLKEIEEEKDRDGVFVPKFSDTRPCSWKEPSKPAQKISFQVMLDVMEFALDYTMIRMPDGRILRQTKGIPMGDPLSPGMTIGTCAWMEQEWLNTVAEGDRKYFRMRRFMDDILLVYAKTEKWDSEKFVEDFVASECYQKPLKLEAGKDGTFLETRFWVEEGNIKHKLKNDNEGGKDNVWRYQHFYSNTAFLQKRATLTACLRKAQSMASDPQRVREGALEKITEFRRLRYPLSVLQKACNYLGATSGEGMWITVRNALR